MPPVFTGNERAAQISISLFGLAPRGVYLAATVTTRAGELLPHRFTRRLRHFKFGISKGRFVFCCTCRHPRLDGCPDVIRLVALWCSDFPLPLREATARPAPMRGRNSIAKNV